MDYEPYGNGINGDESGPRVVIRKVSYSESIES